MQIICVKRRSGGGNICRSASVPDVVEAAGCCKKPDRNAMVRSKRTVAEDGRSVVGSN